MDKTSPCLTPLQTANVGFKLLFYIILLLLYVSNYKNKHTHYYLLFPFHQSRVGILTV